LLPSDKHLSEEGIQHSAEALAGDILMVCIGGSIGKTVISDRRLAFNQQINAIRPLLINSQFLHYAISTTFFLKSVLESATGSATPIINRSRWEQLLVPVAPLEEQDRIVAKVEELMTVCDHLKSHLAEAQTTQLHLANAVVEQTINEGAATKDALAA
jgi:type I restriction enzyme S subunit